MNSEPQLIVNQQSDDETIRVWQQGDRRWLDFDDGLIQSEMSLSKPEVLPLVLNRAMLAGTIFVGLPQRILLAGTGGGVTARYLSHQFPNMVGDAVEISEQVASVAKEYFDFPDTDNWTLVTDDIVKYVKDCPHRYDIIVVDMAINQKIPAWLMEPDFLQRCRSLLTENGYISFNILVDEAKGFVGYLREIRLVFDRQTVCLSMPNYQNTVIMAFNNKPQYSEKEINLRLPKLEAEWGLEFNEFYQQMLNDNPKSSGVI